MGFEIENLAIERATDARKIERHPLPYSAFLSFCYEAENGSQPTDHRQSNWEVKIIDFGPKPCQVFSAKK